MEFVHGEVLDLIPQADQVTIVVDQHPVIEADKVLLATGNQPPAYFSINGEEFNHPHFVANPGCQSTTRKSTEMRRLYSWVLVTP